MPRNKKSLPGIFVPANIHGNGQIFYFLFFLTTPFDRRPQRVSPTPAGSAGVLHVYKYTIYGRFSRKQSFLYAAAAAVTTTASADVPLKRGAVEYANEKHENNKKRWK